MHVAGLGLFVVKINGERVGDEVLNTPFTNYNKSVLYSNYDITSLLKLGENQIEIVLTTTLGLLKRDKFTHFSAIEKYGLTQNIKLINYIVK